MSDWSLKTLLSSLHDDIQGRLKIVRTTLEHPGTKGDASEKVWIDLFNQYLPSRYRADKAHVVDSKGNFSQQIDVVIYDRQYSPFIFQYEGQIIIPAESVYAVFEAKQSATKANIKYAQDKVRSVRKLYRTSLPIPHAGGEYPAKPLTPIYGGLLTVESEWADPMGQSFKSAVNKDMSDGKLDFVCIAAHGYLFPNNIGEYEIQTGSKPATAFLFKLISQLQYSGTVPMIDVIAYSSWLAD
jgi:hypothetical protein